VNPDALAAFPELGSAVAAGAALDESLIQSTIFDAGNAGLTFIWMPQLFAQLPMTRLFMSLFFLTLAFAAFTSMKAQVEVMTRVLVDGGLARSRAVKLVGVGTFSLGLPSAISMRVLNNQDWVWGVALMLAGLFFALAVIIHGTRRFREEQLNHPDSDLGVGRWWDVVIGVLVPIQALILLTWLLVQSWQNDPEGWLRPLAEGSVGTVLLQFAVVLGVLIAANRWLVKQNRPD